MISPAQGRLRHRFHGDYSAVVVLAFETKEAAHAAHIFLLGPQWSVAISDPRALVATMTTPELDSFKATWAQHITIDPCIWRHCRGKCKAAPIDSIAHSVDFGPAFRFHAIKPAKPTKRIEKQSTLSLI